MTTLDAKEFEILQGFLTNYLDFKDLYASATGH